MGQAGWVVSRDSRVDAAAELRSAGQPGAAVPTYDLRLPLPGCARWTGEDARLSTNPIVYNLGFSLIGKHNHASLV